EPIERDGLIETFKTRRPQAACLDFSDNARTRQQRNASAACRQHAADEAADAACPGNTDRWARNHFATPALQRASIAERADHAYRRRPSAPCNRHTPPLCLTRGYGGDDHGFTRRTQRHAEWPARPEHPQRTIRQRRRYVTDDDGDPGAFGLEGHQA